MAKKISVSFKETTKDTRLYMFINGAREIVLYGNAPSLLYIVAMGGVAVLTMIIGLFVFKKNQDKFIYYI